MDDTSDRSRGVALALAVVTGIFGGHRFYVGKIGTGIGMLVTLGGMGLWWLYDCILIAAGEFRDIDGRRLANWETGASGSESRLPHDQQRRLLDALEDVRAEMFELQERVDFMERMLAEVRQRPSVPPGSRD